MLLWQRLMAQSGSNAPTSWTFTYSSKWGSAVVPTQANMSDGSAATYWGNDTSEPAEAFLRADFGSSKTLSSIGYRAAPASAGWGASYLDGATLEYSADGSSWTVATTVASSSESSTSTFTLSSPVSARYVRVTKPKSALWLGIGDFFFG